MGWHARYGFAWRFPTPPLPLIPGERLSFGQPDELPNRLYLGDNLLVMRSLPDASIDLITIDPPFFSGNDYIPRRSVQAERKSGAGFSDVWEGGLAEYLAWLNARLYEMKRLLKPNGTLYVHLDYHAAHYVKVELDKLFGYGHMLNEIIWYMNSGQRRPYAFGPRHNVILRYSLSDTPIFNADAVREPYSPDIHVPVSKAHYYHPEGKVADDVWRIPIISQNDRRERTGYPTQKPEALLERIILASSNPGDVVADFFCGSGTTLVVAARLGRRWIGCDIAPEAIRVTLARLMKGTTDDGGRTACPEQRKGTEDRGQLQPGTPDIVVIYAGMAPAPEPALSGNRAEAWYWGALRETVIRAYGGQVQGEGLVHGIKGREALHVAPYPVSAAEAAAFAQALREGGWKRGTILAVESGQADDRRPALSKAKGRTTDDLPEEGEMLAVVKVTFTPGPCGPLLTLALPPRIRLRVRRIAELTYALSATDSVTLTPGARLERIEWEVKPLDGGEAEVKPEEAMGWKAHCRFSQPGRYAVLCRAWDDRGGEGIAQRVLDLSPSPSSERGEG